MLRFATFLAPSMEGVYAWITERVASRMGTTAELHVGADYAELADGRADVAFLCGLPYVHLADSPHHTVEPVAAPVLVKNAELAAFFDEFDKAELALSPLGKAFRGIKDEDYGKWGEFTDAADLEQRELGRRYAAELQRRFGAPGSIVTRAR